MPTLKLALMARVRRTPKALAKLRPPAPADTTCRARIDSKACLHFESRSPSSLLDQPVNARSRFGWSGEFDLTSNAFSSRIRDLIGTSIELSRKASRG
jgi:hypothetical protein